MGTVTEMGFVRCELLDGLFSDLSFQFLFLFLFSVMGMDKETEGDSKDRRRNRVTGRGIFAVVVLKNVRACIVTKTALIRIVRIKETIVDNYSCDPKM